MPVHRLILGCVLLASLGCGSKTRVTGTATNKVNLIELGHAINADQSIKDKADSFQPGDTIYASIETETLGSAQLKVRWLFEDGQLVSEGGQQIPASGGQIRAGFHVYKPDGWPEGKYRLEVTLDSTVAGIKEFTVKKS
jgi:hypothetical protein